MKQSFETRATLRFYDTTFTKKLDDMYKASGERYESKNQFLTELITIGYNEKLKENSMKREYYAAKKSDDAALDNIRQLIENLHIVNKQQVQELLAHLTISEKLTSAIYNMLLALSEDERISTAQLTLGFYDDLPERLSEELQEILKHILRHLPN